MTYPEDCTLPKPYLEQLAQEGLEGLPEMIRILVNEAMQREVAADIRMIFNAPNQELAESYLGEMVAKYGQKAARSVDWMEANIPEGLSFYEFSQEHWRRIRTTNGLERVSQEIKRRTRVVRIFPNEGSCLRLVTAVLMEISEDWETGRIYLNLDGQ